VIDFQLTRNQAGRLVLTLTDGTVHEGVLPVRAFPVHAAENYVALVGVEDRKSVV
jgi:hypothetical protein